jgi:hypothetical protein
MKHGSRIPGTLLLAVEDFRELVGAPVKPGEVERHAD